VSDPSEPDEVLGEGAVNRERVAVYVRLMEAQQQIAEALAAHGVDDERFVEALEVAESDSEAHDHDIYLTELSRYVTALGGHLELRAVFPQETIVVLRSDAPADEQDS
jgi:hypothetical protein